MYNILITHNDLDGVACGILHRKHFGGNSVQHYVGNHEVDETINRIIGEQRLLGSTASIQITDVSPGKDTARVLDEYDGNVSLIDHHLSALWLTDTYPDWAHVTVGKSATRLLFESLRDSDTVSDYEEFVNLVDDYDMWTHSDYRSKELNRLFYLVGIQSFVERFLDNSAVAFTDTEVEILEVDSISYKRYVRRVGVGMTVLDWDEDIRLGIAYADRYQSELANDLMIIYDLAFVVVVDVNMRKVSLRSRGNFDVSKIAESLGGGGHLNSSGFYLRPSDDISVKHIEGIVRLAFEEVMAIEAYEAFGVGGAE